MTKMNGKDPVLVVVQLSGGLDFMNTLIPHTSEHYRKARPTVGIASEDVLPMNDE
ncbi:MAG: twin-arginine translocation pathway signal, partial [Dehalococcoidia bacterium]|nr:twin-arginine translocation pathway signal [Dehalococcoidia bacterium]